MDGSLIYNGHAYFTSEEIENLLNNIESGADSYVHPSSHPASIITQDTNNRFVSDTEKSTWNNITNKIDTNDVRLSDARTPLAHTQDISSINGLSTVLSNKAETNHTHDLQGLQGDDGLSAYEVAVSNGFTGTEESWLLSLKGADGINGIDGTAGLKGDKGDKGDSFDTVTYESLKVLVSDANGHIAASGTESSALSFLTDLESSKVVVSNENGELTASGTSSSALANIHTHPNQSELDNLPSNLVSDADYVHTDNNYTDADKLIVDGVPALQSTLDLKLNIADALSYSVGEISFYLWDIPSTAIPVYQVLEKTPEMGAEEIDTIIVNNNTVLGHSYITDVLGVTELDAGTFNYHFWRGVSNTSGVSEMLFDWYEYKIDTTEVLLYSHTTGDINNTGITYQELVVTEDTIKTIASTSRLLLKISGKTTRTSDTTITFTHSGTLRNSHVETPILATVPSVIQQALDLKVDTNDSRLSDARTPLAHTQDISSIDGLSTALSLKADVNVFSGNFSLTYNNNQVTEKTYANNNYIVFSYNENNSINQKKSYLSDDTLVLTQTAQYDSNNLFTGWI